MADILFYPPFPNRPQLLDQLFRSVWHFLPALSKLDRLIFPYAGDDYALLDAEQILSMAKIYLSRDLDPRIAELAPRYTGKIAFVPMSAREPAAYTKSKFPNVKGVVVWACDGDTVTAADRIGGALGVDVVRADPVTVQQETLQVMRFVYGFLPESDLKTMVEACYRVFLDLRKTVAGKAISAFGNGPSLATVVAAKIDPGPSLRAVCNSTIGDEAALAHLEPKFLFCGDPVQHCGASLYAGRFRADLARAMEAPERVVITQLGYVPYFRDMLPEDAHARVIGIGNDRRQQFNVDLAAEFVSAATANVFTMLVLPFAFTLSKQVDIYGCDGMSFASATKPWSHANEDDYMGKMAVTHRVHPGFWRRNYEEEFWSYCQDMEDILTAAEAKGITVQNRTPSFVPALAKRYVPVG